MKREGRHNDDIQLHVANAKGERFKDYIRRHGVAPGVRVKFDVDFEVGLAALYTLQAVRKSANLPRHTFVALA